MRYLTITFLFSVWVADATAVLQRNTFELFSDSDPNGSFAGRSPGPDLRCGTADDVDVAGLNAAGHA